VVWVCMCTPEATKRNEKQDIQINELVGGKVGILYLHADVRERAAEFIFL
jgi:hypothetical protein